MSLGDPKREQSRTDKIRSAQARRIAFVKATMELPQGREWMFYLLAECKMYSTSFSKSALEMAFLEGARNVGLWLTAQLVEHAPDDYVKMLRENGEKNERTSNGTSGRVDTDDDPGTSGADPAAFGNA